MPKASPASTGLTTYRQLSEKQLHGLIKDAADLYGWWLIHFADSRRQVAPGVFVGDADAAGWLDIVLIPTRHIDRREVLFRETKGYSRGRLGAPTPEQCAMADLLYRKGFNVGLWTPEDWYSGLIEAELAA